MPTLEEVMEEYKKVVTLEREAIRAGRDDKALEFHKRALALGRLMDQLVIQKNRIRGYLKQIPSFSR